MEEALLDGSPKNGEENFLMDYLHDDGGVGGVLALGDGEVEDADGPGAHILLLVVRLLFDVNYLLLLGVQGCLQGLDLGLSFT